MPVKAKTKRITPASMQRLALLLCDFLESKYLYEDARIYIGTNKRICKYPTNDPDEKPIQTPNGMTVYLSPYDKDRMPTPYYNPKTLLVTTEDDLCSELNKFGKLHEQLDILFAPYGLYLEMGNIWSFSLYEI